MDIQAITNLLEVCQTIYRNLVAFSIAVIGFMTRRIIDLPISDGLKFIVDLLDLENLSILAIFFGGGIIAYFTYQFITWLANLFT